jgi:NhaP-type Na+/H+ or K+/H+ antiporter
MSAPEFRPGHFQSLVFFALAISVAFGFLSRRSAYHRARYILWSFFLFVIIGASIGWVMYPFSR